MSSERELRRRPASVRDGAPGLGADPTEWFATAPKGTASLLAAELQGLGAVSVSEARGGVAFAGPLEVAYRACLWSRVANRVLLPLAEFPAASPAELYDGVRNLPWDRHLNVDGTFAVDFASSQSEIAHTQFGALKVKDAIVDRFRDRHGRRPSVDTRRPGVRVNVLLLRNHAAVSLDLSGDSLHRRGYRGEQGAAPLKENLAAAILLRAGWPSVAAAGGALIDLMCGSGTLPIEAGLIAADVAPGLLRTYFGFLGWRRHDPDLWARLLAEAHDRRAAGCRRLPPIAGYDSDRRAVAGALANVERAGLRGLVHIERRDLTACEPLRSPTGAAGLVVVNPPYGERLGDSGKLEAVYAALGAALRARFAGWTAWILAGNRDLAFRLGLRARRRYSLLNGTIDCDLLVFPIDPAYAQPREYSGSQARTAAAGAARGRRAPDTSRS